MTGPHVWSWSLPAPFASFLSPDLLSRLSGISRNLLPFLPYRSFLFWWYFCCLGWEHLYSLPFLHTQKQNQVNRGCGNYCSTHVNKVVLLLDRIVSSADGIFFKIVFFFHSISLDCTEDMLSQYYRRGNKTSVGFMKLCRVTQLYPDPRFK